MHIEVITTKKRLTKTLLKQFKEGENIKVLNECNEILGYVLNAIKGKYKAVIIKSSDDYYVLATNWIKGEKRIYRKIDGTKYSISIPFKSEESLNIFWNKLQNILNEANKKHIYI